MSVKYCRFCADHWPPAIVIDLSLDVQLKMEILENLSIFLRHGVDFADETLPATVCTNCRKTLRVCRNFFFKVRQTQNVLRDLIQSDESRLKQESETKASHHKVEVDAPRLPTFPNSKSDEVPHNILEATTSKVKEEYFSDNEGGVRSPALSQAKKFSFEDEVEFKPDCMKLEVEDNPLNINIKEEILIEIDVCKEESVLKTQPENIENPQMTEKDSFEGTACGVTFPTRQQLLDHTSSNKDHHPLKKKTGRPKSGYNCGICHKVIIGRSEYEEHKLIHPKRSRDYTCICGKSFFTKYALRAHNKLVHISDPQVCNICQKVFKNNKSLKLHLKRHGGGVKFECDTCHLKFNTRGQITDHMIKHTNIFPHLCKFCGKQFKRKRYLQSHENVHNKEQPHKCTVCKKKFTMWSNCNKHMKRKHGLTLANTVKTALGRMPVDQATGQPLEMKFNPLLQANYKEESKNFMCDGCGKVFPTKQTLTEHQKIAHRTHESQECKVCNAKLKNWRHLKMHMKKHREGTYECHHCHKVFRNKENLSQHLIIHTDTRPFHCEHCGNTFKRRANLQKHLKNVHDIILKHG